MNIKIPVDYNELLMMHEELKELTEYRRTIGNKFIERMLYDFNTLLNSITGYMYSALETADPAQKPSIDGALNTSKALLSKFNEMTDYLSLVLGGYELNIAPFSLSQVMRQVHQGFDEALSAKSLNFSCEIDGKIPAYVQTDGTIVRKAVSMLVENAIQNSSSGTIKVTASLVSEDKDFMKIKISVTDEGKGADLELIHSVLSGTGLDEVSLSGVGLGRFGLLTAKDFLERLGSFLTVENNIDKGATFSFILDVEGIQSVSGEKETLAHKRSAAINNALAGVKILFADDSVIMQQIVRQMLESEGAEVTVASNGEEAVSLFSNGKFNVILMDIEMPVLNGHEATMRIKATENKSSGATPIIGMTAHTKQEEYDKCIECGMSAVVVKPFKHKGLMDAIYKELYHKEYEDAPEEELAGKTSAYNFEKIKGIDYKEGLKRLSGNEKVYFELLQNFRDGYSDTPAYISSLLKEGNDNEVKNLLHLIKGISGNLSFNKVYDYANELRDAVDMDNIAEITKYLKLFGEAVEEFKASFEAVEVDILYNMSELEDVDLLLVKTRLNELLSYLSGDVDLGNAVDACDDIYDYMKATEHKKDFKRIRDAVNAFDLELATPLLEKFIKKFT